MMKRDDNEINSSSRSKLFLALVILLAVCLTLVLTYMVSARDNNSLAPESWSEFMSKVNQTMDQNNTRIIWHNETRITSGIPFFENDIYDILEAAPKIGTISYDKQFGMWSCVICVADVSSARAKNTSNPANVYKSQSLAMGWPRDQAYFGISYTPGYTHAASLPSSRTFDDHYAQSPGNITLRWDYSTWPFGDKSDCGYLVYIDTLIKPGHNASFELIDTADYGLMDSSHTTLRFNITAPPNPENISEPDLQKYGIRKDSYGNYYVYADQAIIIT